ncbi:MAG: hypothetical protein ACYTAF_17300 [Planctomycetota bacterium]|jgi:hypothetical protein
MFDNSICSGHGELTPEGAGEYLEHARAAVGSLGDSERNRVLRDGGRLVDGLFSFVEEDIPLSREEQAVLAAHEWTCAGGTLSAYVLARIRKAILNVALARVYAGVAASWASRKRDPHPASAPAGGVGNPRI